MKLIILKDNFKNGLSSIERAVQESGNLPILKNFLFKTQKNMVRISATNLEIGIDKFISGKIIEEGSIAIPFSTLYSIVSNTDSERINFETEKNSLVIKTDNYQAKIQGVAEEEFPIIPKIENQTSFIKANSELFADALSSVVNAAQISEIRPEISGVFMDFQITTLRLAATDSFRLAEKTVYDREFESSANKGWRVIVPLKTAQEVVRIAPKNQEISIYTDSNQILFKWQDQELISRLIDGQYPDYDQIVPKTIESEMILNKEQLLNAVRLVSSLSGKVNDIKLATKNGAKTLEIFSSNQHLGENNYLIPIKMRGDEFKEITLNWRYLVDGLKAIKSQEVILGLNGDAKPAIIKSPEDASYFYILMPIKAS